MNLPELDDVLANDPFVAQLREVAERENWPREQWLETCVRAMHERHTHMLAKLTEAEALQVRKYRLPSGEVMQYTPPDELIPVVDARTY